MIVDKFDVQGFAVSPCEADAPLIVDADAVGALAVAAEFLQPVARRTAEIQGFFGSIEHLELDACPFLDILGQSSHGESREDGCGLLVGETADHAKAYRSTVRPVNRDVLFDRSCLLKSLKSRVLPPNLT